MRFLFSLMGLSLLVACGKKQEANVLIGTAATFVNDTTVDVTLDIDYFNGSKLGYVGVYYGIHSELDTSQSNYYYYYSYYGENNGDHYGRTYLSGVKASGNSNTVSLEGLNDNCWYYIIPYATVDGKRYLGTLDSFQTPKMNGTNVGPAGGYVIYDDGMGGGIEMLPFDFAIKNSTSEYRNYFGWGCTGDYYGVNSTAIGTGMSNSSVITGSCNEPDIAAKMCENLSYGGYSDWYLPSIDELSLSKSVLHVLGAGNLTNNEYWSSTELDGSYAHSFNPAVGIGYTEYKNSSNLVRPVRSF